MIRRKALAALIACITITGVASRALSQSPTPGNALFLWRVTSATGGEAWLFGSIHAGTKDMYPLPDPIEKAFAGSKKLVVEADIENLDPAGMQSLVLSRGLYPLGDSLSKHLKPETIALVRNFAAKSGIPFEAMEQMRPWLVSVTLLSLTLQDTGLDPALGLDVHFLKAAKAAMKEVLELEGATQQLDILAGLPDADQEANLVAGLSDAGGAADELPKLINAWKAGDTAAIEAISTASMKEHPETKPTYELLLNKRNEKMLEKIEGYLKTKDTHFVVVGALHLVGEKGIVRLLESRKYKVEQIKRP